jgi:hypothetical protein
MTNERNAKLTRREMLKTWLTAGGVVLAGFHELRIAAFCADVKKDAFRGGRYLGLIEFLGEGRIPMDTLLSHGSRHQRAFFESWCSVW